LIITGQNIGHALIKQGADADSIFYSEYLHSKFIAENSSAATIMGITGDPISQGMVLSLSRSSNSQPDVIEVKPPAQALFKYLPGFAEAALRYENNVNGSRLIYFAFGLERISGPGSDAAAKVLSNALAWLNGITSVDHDLPGLNTPKVYSLHQNFPNPFNPKTTIQYSISNGGLVSIKVYNVLGEEIASLVNRNQAPGFYEVIFDGNSLPSGIYYYQLMINDFIGTKKLVLLK
jgi:hypothetical protein